MNQFGKTTSFSTETKSKIMVGVLIVLVLLYTLLQEWFGRVDFSSRYLRAVQAHTIGFVPSGGVELAIVLSIGFWIILAVVGNNSPGKENATGVGVWYYLWTNDVFLVCFVVWCICRYVLQLYNPESFYTAHSSAHTGVQLRRLLECILIAQLLKWLCRGTEEFKNYCLGACATCIIILLTLLSCSRADIPEVYRYEHQVRQTGFWVNPNTFGQLMGLGGVLAVARLMGRCGLIYARSRREDGKRKALRDYFLTTSLVIAVCLTMRGLLGSYSRGAWVATLCALTYLIVRGLTIHECDVSATDINKAREPAGKKMRIGLGKRVKGKWLLAFATLSVGLLCFLPVRAINLPSMHRLISVVDVNDFSWRNRVTAWKGALQIMAQHPWFGTGWNQAEEEYAHYYLPPKLSEGGAIETNDYLMLGAAVGVPGLSFLVVYISLALFGLPYNRPHEPDEPDSRYKWSLTTFRAGVILLAVGFWFDGGLFEVATAALFWICAELSRIGGFRGNPDPKIEESQ